MSRRRKVKSKGCTFTGLLGLTGLVAIFTGHGWAGVGLLLAAGGWQSLIGPPSQEKLIRQALSQFHQMGFEEWKKLEGKALKFYPGSACSHLLYALRITHAVPSVTQMPTLASRWNTAHMGAGQGGLVIGKGGPLSPQVEAFILGVFAERVGLLLKEDHESYQAKLSRAKTPAARRKLQETAQRRLLDWETSFHFDMPGLADVFAHYYQMTGPAEA